MLQVFRQFDAFVGIDQEILADLERHAKLVDVPAGRWLVRRGRTVRGSLYLVSGTVRLVEPDQVVAARHPRARAPLYPGVRGLVSLTNCRLLQVREAGLELLGAATGNACATLVDDDDCWQARFLRSRLMAPLPRVVWQRVLTELEARQAGAGETLIVEGDEEQDRCYVLASGSVTVSRENRLLNTLGPGDLFGEDALISGLPRNASVKMRGDGLVMTLGAPRFERLLGEVLECVPLAVASELGVRRLTFDSVAGLREHVEALNRNVEYLVRSASPRVLELALFLMRKRGLACASAGFSAGSDQAP